MRREALTERRAANYWPTPDQELVLRAALLPAPMAGAAWRQVAPRLDLAAVPPATRRLLPLVYRNLTRQRDDDPLRPQLKRIYVDAWSANQFLFRHAGPLLDSLAAEGIPTLLLKGAALVERYYGGEPGLRPMSDLDLAVPSALAPRAIDVLVRAGWRPRHALTPSFLRVKHAAVFEGRGGDCDLHWHVFEECCRPADDDELWAAADAIQFRGRPTRVLSASDQLLHVCVHGLKWVDVPGIRWIADAVLVLAAGPVDWSRVVAQSRRGRYVLRMREALAYLRDRMSAPVPASALDALAAAPVTPLERFERRVLRREHRVLGQLPLYWCHHRRAHQGGPLAAALAFPDYLRDAWGLTTLGAVGPGAVARATRRIRRVFRGAGQRPEASKSISRRRRPRAGGARRG